MILTIRRKPHTVNVDIAKMMFERLPMHLMRRQRSLATVRL